MTRQTTIERVLKRHDRLKQVMVPEEGFFTPAPFKG